MSFTAFNFNCWSLKQSNKAITYSSTCRIWIQNRIFNANHVHLSFVAIFWMQNGLMKKVPAVYRLPFSRSMRGRCWLKHDPSRFCQNLYHQIPSQAVKRRIIFWGFLDGGLAAKYVVLSSPIANSYLILREAFDQEFQNNVQLLSISKCCGYKWDVNFAQSVKLFKSNCLCTIFH